MAHKSVHYTVLPARTWPADHRLPNRREAIIAAWNAPDLRPIRRTFGVKHGSPLPRQPLVVRHDKDGAWHFSAHLPRKQSAFPATVVGCTIGAGDTRAGGVPLQDWRQAGRPRTPYRWGNAVWLRSYRGGDWCAPTREAPPSHTKRIASLRYGSMPYSQVADRAPPANHQQRHLPSI
ncbi:hypothetical protein KCP78_10045 [Salmonella enterica subsp. enterica]|nr:hypothetical protein KCP78_10045 [Salmonella enterica subsp. enterica]